MIITYNYFNKLKRERFKAPKVGEIYLKLDDL